MNTNVLIESKSCESVVDRAGVMEEEGKNMLKPFLPTAEEIEEMDKYSFQDWVFSAEQELKQREIERDPLSHLRKRISSVLSDEELTEEQREKRVLYEIEKYNRLIART